MEWILGAVIGVIVGFIIGVWQGLSKAKKTFTEEYFVKKLEKQKTVSDGGKPVEK